MESMPRKSVTSDPDRGVPVNSGTDPQRPGTPGRPSPSDPTPDTSPSETSAPAGRFEATHENASSGRGADVERGSPGEGDDPAE